MRFLTLGPESSNHALVARRYLDFRGLTNASVVFIDDFFEGLQMMSDGAADFMIQVAVHPDCTDVVAKAHFVHDIHIIDTFISPSKQLAILTRVDVATPREIALQPATKCYADISAWEKWVPETSTSAVAQGLLRGAYESGITALDVCEQHPGKFRVDRVIGTVDDPWLVFGKRRVCESGIVAWPDSPGAQQFRS
jgi:hypothetical protein